MSELYSIRYINLCSPYNIHLKSRSTHFDCVYSPDNILDYASNEWGKKYNFLSFLPFGRFSFSTLRLSLAHHMYGFFILFAIPRVCKTNSKKIRPIQRIKSVICQMLYELYELYILYEKDQILFAQKFIYVTLVLLWTDEFPHQFISYCIQNWILHQHFDLKILLHHLAECLYIRECVCQKLTEMIKTATRERWLS